MLLILGEGGHHHGECSGILTGDQGIPAGGEYELLELSFDRVVVGHCSQKTFHHMHGSTV